MRHPRAARALLLGFVLASAGTLLPDRCAAARLAPLPAAIAPPLARAPLPAAAAPQVLLQGRLLPAAWSSAPADTGTAPRRHARGGWHLAVVFGDSADYTRHNAAIVAVASTTLLAVLWSLPADMNRFETPNPSWSQFRQAWTQPPLLADGDWWAWNWIGHPVTGTHQYLMERNWGASQRRAFLFSALASLAWEYGWEATVERPSVQDMLLTAPVGWAIGESIHRLTQHLRRNGFTTTEKLIVVLLSPLYPLQHGFR
jgi:hypothetical protein